MARIDDIRELAESVMGWKTRILSAIGGLKLHLPDECARIWVPSGIRDGHQWDPFTDANAALEVVEALQCRFNLQAVIFQKKRGYACVIQQMHDDIVAGSATEDTFCEAICAAALAAKRSGAKE